MSPASRLTPRLILPALTIVAWRAAASILASSAGGEPGRADDMDDARLRREAGKGDGRRRRGEIEHAIDLGEDRQRVVGDGDAEGPEARDLAKIAAECGRALGLDAGGERAARRLGEGAGERLAHAPCGAEHGELHVPHG